jgi:flagellar motor switch/type III secretory pathway protein FliN
MTEFRPWLPRGYMTSQRAQDTLQVTLAEWREAWFAPSATGTLETKLTTDGRSLSRPAVSEVMHGWTVSVGGGGQRRLLELLLGCPLEGRELGPKDHRLLEALARRAARDLAGRLDRLVEGTFAKMTSGEPSLRLVITADRSDLLTIEVRPQILVELLRRRLERRPRTGALVSLASALQQSEVVVDAVLGSARTKLGAVRHLEPGDIVLLDRVLAQGAQLRVAGRDAGFASGAVTQDNGRNAIAI